LADGHGAIAISNDERPLAIGFTSDLSNSSKQNPLQECGETWAAGNKIDPKKLEIDPRKAVSLFATASVAYLLDC
jgi:hypothetical protein